MCSFQEIYGQTPYSDKFQCAVTSGIVKDPLLYEASGIVASRTNPGYFWAHNDSGDGPYLYLIDSLGNIKRKYILKDAFHFDWEDITIGFGPTDNYYLYIGDIGDNLAIRPFINVYRFIEPDIRNTTDSVISNADNLILKYPDGPRDAETLLYDPVFRNLFIITKREENVRVYETPEQFSDTTTLIFKSKLPFKKITGGDISASGDEILLKNYNAVFYWIRKTNDPIDKTLSSDHEILHYKSEPQGEAIAWSIHNDGFYTLSERNNSKKQKMLFYKRTTNE